MRLDNRVLGNSKPKNSWQDLTISILLVLIEELHKKSVNSKVQWGHLGLILNVIFLRALSPTKSTLRNKCGSFSAIMWNIWTTLNTQFQKHVTITAERAKITYACYTILFNAVCHHCSIKAMMMMMTIQHDGGRRIDFWQMSMSPGHTMANNCKTAFSLHVVESASDDYNF